MTQSESLVRRQKFTKQLRRKDLENKMQTIRSKLLEYQQLTLQSKDIDYFHEMMQKQQYSQTSAIKFLEQLQRFTTESITNRDLLHLFEKCLMHFLQKGQNKINYSRIHSLAKQHITRIIEFGNTDSKNLQQCFQQILEIVQNHDFQMLDAWKIVALNRSPIFFKESFIRFRLYMRNYKTNLENQVIPMLQIFANFTSRIQGSVEVTLPISELFQIINDLDKIFQVFEFGDREMQITVSLLKNILQLHSFRAVIELIIGSNTIFHLISYLHQVQDISNSTKTLIAQLIGICFSGESEIGQKIIKKNPNLIQTLCRLLPDFQCYKLDLLSTKQPRWSKYNQTLIIAILFCLCNIVSCPDSIHFKLKFQIINWMRAFSINQSSNIRQEISIFLYNCLLNSSDQQIQILLEKQILVALNNLINEQYGRAAQFGLKALKRTLQISKNFPQRNMVWSYRPERITIDCDRMGLISYIQGLTICKKQQVSKLAIKCLQLFKRSQL